MLLARECVEKRGKKFTNKITFFDGDPTIIGVTDVGSDVGIDNAEICSITANSLEQFR
jgi:hypothetical protein